MLNHIPTRFLIFRRGFKNFGHKRQPEALVTVLWHGFLTFTFIGLGIEWKRIANYISADKTEDLPSPSD